jgi:lauroyl/myristoyl acyltransferase
MKSKTGKKLIIITIWAMQWFLMAAAMFAMVEYFSTDRLIDLFSGCFLVFSSFLAHNLRREFNIQLAKGVRDAANRDWLSKQNRQTRRKYGVKGRKPRRNNTQNINQFK